MAEVITAGKKAREDLVGKCPDVPENSLPSGMSAYDWDESQGLHCVIGSVTYADNGRIVTLQGQFPASRLIATMRQIIGR